MVCLGLVETDTADAITVIKVMPGIIFKNRCLCRV